MYESDVMYFLIEFNLVGRGQMNDCNIVTTDHLPKDKILADKGGHTFELFHKNKTFIETKNVSQTVCTS